VVRKPNAKLLTDPASYNNKLRRMLSDHIFFNPATHQTLFLEKSCPRLQFFRNLLLLLR